MAHLTLYRKYRPQNFAEIVNQQHVKLTIQQEIVNGDVSHAFLFYGPRGIGKTTTARVLAKALNCEKRKKSEFEPCNTCDTCKAITEGSSLSIVEVDAASQTGVDNVRDNIIANARIAVKANEYKVFIIDEVHMLSTPSFNALLKTLEEPPERVIFVLATTEIHKIPETIISRCQRFDFHTIEASILKEHLLAIAKKEKRKIDDQVVSSIVKKSGGYARDAMSLLGQVFTLEGDITVEKASFILPVSNQEDIILFLEHIAALQIKEAMLFLTKKQQEGFKPHIFAQDCIDFLHELMLKAIGSHPDIFEGEVSTELLPRIETLSKNFSSRQFLELLDVFIKRRQELKNLDQGILPLELAVIQVCAAHGAPPAPVHRPTPQPVAPRQAPVQPQPAAPKPSTPPVEPVVKPAEPAKPKPIKKVEPIVEEAAPVAIDPNNTCSFQEVQSQWGSIMQAISDGHHSVFIVLNTAQLREGPGGVPELAFKYQMHHDHVKRSMGVIVDYCKDCLPGKAVQFNLVLDQGLERAPLGDVEEPQSEEVSAIADEFSSLADAFGGSVME